MLSGSDYHSAGLNRFRTYRYGRSVNGEHVSVGVRIEFGRQFAYVGGEAFETGVVVCRRTFLRANHHQSISHHGSVRRGDCYVECVSSETQGFRARAHYLRTGTVSLGGYGYGRYVNRGQVIRHVGIEGGYQFTRIHRKCLEPRVAVRILNLTCANDHNGINQLDSGLGVDCHVEHVYARAQLFQSGSIDNCARMIRLGTYGHRRGVDGEQVIKLVGRERRRVLSLVHREVLESCVVARHRTSGAGYSQNILFLCLTVLGGYDYLQLIYSDVKVRCAGTRYGCGGMIRFRTYIYPHEINRKRIVMSIRIEGGSQLASGDRQTLETCVAARNVRFGACHGQFIIQCRFVFGGYRYVEYIVAQCQRLRARSGNRRGSIISLRNYRYRSHVNREIIV